MKTHCQILPWLSLLFSSLISSPSLGASVFNSCDFQCISYPLTQGNCRVLLEQPDCAISRREIHSGAGVEITYFPFLSAAISMAQNHSTYVEMWKAQLKCSFQLLLLACNISLKCQTLEIHFLKHFSLWRFGVSVFIGINSNSSLEFTYISYITVETFI